MDEQITQAAARLIADLGQAARRLGRRLNRAEVSNWARRIRTFLEDPAHADMDPRVREALEEVIVDAGRGTLHIRRCG